MPAARLPRWVNRLDVYVKPTRLRSAHRKALHEAARVPPIDYRDNLRRAAQGGQYCTPIGGQFWTPIDTSGRLSGRSANASTGGTGKNRTRGNGRAPRHRRRPRRSGKSSRKYPEQGCRSTNRPPRASASRWTSAFDRESAFSCARRRMLSATLYGAIVVRRKRLRPAIDDPTDDPRDTIVQLRKAPASIPNDRDREANSFRGQSGRPHRKSASF